MGHVKKECAACLAPLLDEKVCEDNIALNGQQHSKTDNNNNNNNNKRGSQDTVRVDCLVTGFSDGYSIVRACRLLCVPV